MDTIRLTDEETGEEIPVCIIEETTLSGKHYLLVTPDEDAAKEMLDGGDEPSGDETPSDMEVILLREVSDDGENLCYEPVTDEKEIAAILPVFSELLDDAEFES